MELSAPHKVVETRNEKEKFLVQLLDSLWLRYKSRMPFVQLYEKVVIRHGAVFFNDHIAFRTIAWQKPLDGIFSISRIFEALGYTARACYEFPDKHLNSIHFQHSNPKLPKLFITQLKSWELSDEAQKILSKSISKHRPALASDFLSSLSRLENIPAAKREKLLQALKKFFAELPWPLPQKKDVITLDKETQYGAWVLVNGYDVNHFTALVDSHNVPSLNDIEKTVEAMRQAGIPMKKEIEGARGTRLRQSSTEAVVGPVAVKEGAKTTKMSWSYAYFEIAERPLMRNAQGVLERFEGFLGDQATHLFDMTKLKS